MIHPYIIEYLQHIGQLPEGTLLGEKIFLADEGNGIFIKEWDLPGNPQPTEQEIQAIIDSPEYQDYLINREPINEKKANEKRFDTDKLDIAIYETIVDEFNKRRKFERDLLAAVAAATTLANMKSGIAAIVTQNAEISYSDAKQLVKNKL